jgi:hypothetical protein
MTPHPVTSRRSIVRKSLVLLAGCAALLPGQAFAVSSSVKFACMSDYLSYCSQHEVGSQALRQCMRANGPRLSARCVKALVGAGEVSQAEVARRSAKAD